MGLLDFIPLAGDAIDAAGQMLTNSANAKQAQLNREFQERMSSTAHQREVADYKAAGLNPALAYGRGGESTPSGSTATLENPGKGLGSSAAAVMALRNQTKLTQSQIAATNAQAAKTKAEAFAQQIDNSVAAERVRLGITRDRFGNTESYERGYNLKLQNDMLFDTWEPRFRMAQAQLDNMQQNTATAKASAMLQDIQRALASYDIPAAQARAKAAKTWVGQNMAPWLEPILSIIDRFIRITSP